MQIDTIMRGARRGIKSRRNPGTRNKVVPFIPSVARLSLSLFLFLSSLIRPEASERLVRIVRCGNERLRLAGEGSHGRNYAAHGKRRENKRKRTGECASARRFRLARGEISFSFLRETPISRMPAGCVYFVSFYITRYPRDLDSIYFLLVLRPSSVPVPSST